MGYKRINYTSDFALTIENAFDWTKPFKARFYTTASRHAKVVRFDGIFGRVMEAQTVHILDDGGGLVDVELSKT